MESEGWEELASVWGISPPSEAPLVLECAVPRGAGIRINIPAVAARGPSLIGSLAARPALPGCAVPTLESSLEGRLPRPGEGTGINCFRSLSGGRLPLSVPHSGAPLAHWMAFLSGDLTRELNVSHFHRTA